jgi:multiple sugar transport system permease protein
VTPAHSAAVPWRQSPMHRQQRRLFWLFLVPGLTYLVGVRVAPALFTLTLSLTDWKLIRGATPRFVGLANYVRLAHDGPFIEAVGRTLLFAVSATGLELLLGLAIALFVNRELRGRTALRAILLTPMVITPAVVGLIWYILYHKSIGPLNYFLSLLDLPSVGWLTSPHVALASLILTDLWHWTPFMFLLALSALQVVPTELYEAADVDGATRLQAFRSVTLPLIWDTLMVGCILRSMDAFEIFAEPFVMTGGGPGRATETVSLFIYKSAFTFFDMGYAGAMIAVSILLIASVYSIYLRHVRFD